MRLGFTILLDTICIVFRLDQTSEVSGLKVEAERFQIYDMHEIGVIARGRPGEGISCQAEVPFSIWEHQE